MGLFKGYIVKTCYQIVNISQTITVFQFISIVKYHQCQITFIIRLEFISYSQTITGSEYYNKNPSALIYNFANILLGDTPMHGPDTAHLKIKI